MGWVMKKKIIISFVIIFIFAFIGFKIYSDAVKIIKQPFMGNSGTITIEVNNGDSLNKVINSLYSEDKIANSYLVKWYIKKQKLNTNIKPGKYTVNQTVSLESFVNMLNEGKYNINAAKVTIPEGYNVEDIASLLEEKGVIGKEEFIKECKEYELPSYIKTDSKRKYALEGYLFPDTYEFIKGMKGKEIIDVMIKNFEKNIQDIEKKSNTVIDKQEIDKIIIKASIVEREAQHKDERATIASVINNRLEKKMKLQMDATVEYALGEHKTIYSYKDIAVESPYNTYVVEGLPIGPIGNPGKASIAAVINPDNTDYLYYVSIFDGTGKHFFTNNYKKFLEYKEQSKANLSNMNK